MSGVTSATVRACACGACCTDAKAAEAASRACIWRLVHSEVLCTGSLAHLSIAFLLCLLFCLRGFLQTCKQLAMSSDLHKSLSDIQRQYWCYHVP